MWRLLCLLSWVAGCRSHTCAYVLESYTVAGGNGTCCDKPAAERASAPEIQRVLLSFDLAKRPLLDVGSTDAARTDGDRFVVTLLRPPDLSTTMYFARLEEFAIAQPVSAYVPTEPVVLSFDDLSDGDRARLRHALGGVHVAHFPATHYAPGVHS